MTVGDLMKELQPLDPTLEVVVSQRRRGPWSRTIIRDIEDAGGCRAEVLAEVRVLNATHYCPPGVGDNVTRLVVYAEGDEGGLVPARSA